MTRCVVLAVSPLAVALLSVTQLRAQSPPPLSPAEIARLHSVKAWDLEYSYHFSDIRSGSRTLEQGTGGVFGGKGMDGWQLNWVNNFDYLINGTIAGKSGQSDCGYGSDSCVIKYTYPAAVTGIVETFDRFDEAHFWDCCPDGQGGFGPGTQSLHSTYDLSGSKTLDGAGANWIRGRLAIDYYENPPVADAYFYSPTLGTTGTTAYAGWYRSDTSTYPAGSSYSVDMYSGDPSGLQVRIENGRFVIRGSDTYTQTYVPCSGAWGIPCDSNTRAGSATLTYTSEWVITSHPDSSITLTRPSAGDLFVSGETDTIRWLTDTSDSLRILYSTDSGKTYTPVAGGIAAADRQYAWKVPEALSRKCRIRIESMIDTANYDTSGLFNMKGFVLTRITAAGDYEAFTPLKHGWWFPNTDQYTWPLSWWFTFDYQNGTDPHTGAKYPSSLFAARKSELFPDWPLFVTTFGVDTCYTSAFPTGDSASYRYGAYYAWSLLARRHPGSCEGMAVSSAAAFGNWNALAAAFPVIGPPGDINNLPNSDSILLMINQLWLTQHSRAVKEHEALPYNATPNQAWIDTLKAIFLGDDRSRDVSLGMYGWGGSTGHAVTPYKLQRDSGLVPGEPYYLISVYDNNDPLDTGAAVLVRPGDGFWRYPADGPAPLFVRYGSGLKLDPFSLYLWDAELRFPKTKPWPFTPAMTAGAPVMNVMLSAGGAGVTIRSPGGDSTGYADSLIFSTIPGAEPIQMKTGYSQPPIGYTLPDSGWSYEVAITGFTDTSASFAVFSDSMVLDLRREGILPGETDRYTFGTGSLEFHNDDAVAKTVDMRSMLVTPYEDRVTRVLGYGVSAGGSAGLVIQPDGRASLQNTGAGSSYILQEILSREGEQMKTFLSDPIPVNAGATHGIRSDWNDLAGDVMILVDEGSDGSVDDSLQVSNVLSAVGDAPAAPKRFALYGNYPNPFNPSTTIVYEIPATVRIALTLHDVLGREVASIAQGVRQPGRYEEVLDASALPGGVYFCTLRAGSFVQTEKLILLK